MLVRADILIKRERNFELIEVKAKSFDGTDIEEISTGGTSVFWKKKSPPSPKHA
jgi:hypothetical protein